MSPFIRQQIDMVEINKTEINWNRKYKNCIAKYWNSSFWGSWCWLLPTLCPSSFVGNSFQSSPASVWVPTGVKDRLWGGLGSTCPRTSSAMGSCMWLSAGVVTDPKWKSSRGEDWGIRRGRTRWLMWFSKLCYKYILPCINQAPAAAFLSWYYIGMWFYNFVCPSVTNFK